MSRVNRKQWSNDEIQTVFQFLPIFGIQFKMYTNVINRSVSQIKSFYYNNLQRIRSREQRASEQKENKEISCSLIQFMRIAVVDNDL
ncbi:Conserved_hypothetical protein [Hexamita inflata]|uniref:Myb-like DNA-binding domain-containing protein n=1 Tax=Hexamita inflata TaxID=28002 RepID=A0AA86NPF2_9EUKA|nr:Conserved hypothetical protein [Hexamita inflata]